MAGRLWSSHAARSSSPAVGSAVGTPTEQYTQPNSSQADYSAAFILSLSLWRSLSLSTPLSLFLDCFFLSLPFHSTLSRSFSFSVSLSLFFLSRLSSPISPLSQYFVSLYAGCLFFYVFFKDTTFPLSPFLISLILWLPHPSVCGSLFLFLPFHRMSSLSLKFNFTLTRSLLRALYPFWHSLLLSWPSFLSLHFLILSVSFVSQY